MGKKPVVGAGRGEVGRQLRCPQRAPHRPGSGRTESPASRRPALRFPRTVGKLSRSSSSLLSLHPLLFPFPYRSVLSGLSNSTPSLSLSRHNVRQLPGDRRHPQGLRPRWFAVRQEMHQAYVEPWLYIAQDLVN